MAFHEGFPFVRSAVAQVLAVAGQKATTSKLNFDLLQQETNLGRNYIKAMPRYCQAAGLLDFNHNFTSLGLRIYERDPHLERLETLWLCHYNLAASEGPGPLFWNLLVCEHLSIGEEVKTTALGHSVRENSEAGGNPIAERTACTAASVFLGTYSRSDCLGKLGILESQEVGSYLVKEAESPPPLVFAYAIANYWHRNLPNQTSAWIDEFNKAGGPAQVLFMGGGQINQAMRELSEMGIATVQLTQPPYQFCPLWKNQNEILERIYGL